MSVSGIFIMVQQTLTGNFPLRSAFFLLFI